MITGMAWLDLKIKNGLRFFEFRLEEDSRPAHEYHHWSPRVDGKMCLVRHFMWVRTDKLSFLGLRQWLNDDGSVHHMHIHAYRGRDEVFDIDGNMDVIEFLDVCAAYNARVDEMESLSVKIEELRSEYDQHSEYADILRSHIESFRK